MHKTDIGRIGQDYIAKYLLKQGYTIFKENWKKWGFEVDIIAQQGDVVVFCEVKMRKGDFYQDFDQISECQVQRLLRAGELFLSDCYKEYDLRIDLFCLRYNEQTMEILSFQHFTDIVEAW